MLLEERGLFDWGLYVGCMRNCECLIESIYDSLYDRNQEFIVTLQEREPQVVITQLEIALVDAYTQIEIDRGSDC